MIILKDAYVFTLNPKNEFGRYSLLIDEERIIDITPSAPIEHPADKPVESSKLNRWMERYSSNVEVIDCRNKVIMPPFVNPCLKSEGALIKYLLRYRGYERTDDNLYTDFMLNYIYQELQTEEMRQDLGNIYNYSFSKNLKSGVIYLNEFSLRKDINHLNPITNAQRLTSQKINVCYPIRQDDQTIHSFKHLNPGYYLTDENQLTIYDISQLTELKKNNQLKLFLEVSTNKDVVDKFRHTFNKPIILLLNEYGLIDENATLINPVYLSYEEIKTISDKKANVIICPTDLSIFSSRYFPMDELLSHRIKFTIATGWLGDDLLDELRIFRNKYKELNFSNEDLLMSVIKTPRELYFYHDSLTEEPYCIAPNKIADLIFFDVSDIRFQLLPENFTLKKMCDYIVDNLSSSNISDIMINGDFKVKEGRIVYFNEKDIIKNSLITREHLYKIGKYKEINERTKRREYIEKIDISNRDEDEIKLFAEPGTKETVQGDEEMKEDFRIKGKVPLFKRKSTPSQQTLFDDNDSGNIIPIQDYQETPEINLLYSEIDETKSVDDEIIYSKIADAKILKQTSAEKKPEKSELQNAESKIELPKDVKLKFGDD